MLAHGFLDFGLESGDSLLLTFRRVASALSAIHRAPASLTSRPPSTNASAPSKGRKITRLSRWPLTPAPR